MNFILRPLAFYKGFEAGELFLGVGVIFAI
jgi:hypothetical protein